MGSSWVISTLVAVEQLERKVKAKTRMANVECIHTVFPKIDVVVLQRLLSNMSVLCQEDVIRAITGKN